METFQIYAKELAALLVPFITWLLNSTQRHRAKLFVGQRHGFTFLVQEPIKDEQGNVVQPVQNVATVSHQVNNSGKSPATNVELVFNWKPACVNIWPLRHYEEKSDPNRRFVMVFPSLAPGESIGVDLLDVNRELPSLLTVRCDQCVATSVTMAPQRVWPPWMNRTAAFLVWAGMAATAYVIISALQWVLAAS